MTPRFNVGDPVFLAKFQASEKRVACPDCGGTGQLRVTFHDETTVSIGCTNCSRGYDDPTGAVTVHERKPTAEALIVNGLEIEGTTVRYRLGGGPGWHWIGEDADVFATPDEAMVRAQVLADEATKEERQRVYRKERDTRSWSWNATYHRKAIKEAHRQIDYHTRKLNVAAIKAKEKVEAA